MSQQSDYSPTQINKPIRVGLTLPTTCKRGEVFFLVSTTAAGNKVYASFALNTWTQIFDASGQNNTNRTSVTVTGAAVSVAATNILINAAVPVAGLYKVTVYLNVKTQPTIGTIAVAIAWNDGAARTINIVGATDINSSTGVSVAVGSTQILADGVHNVTYAITYATLTGVPSTDFYLAIEKVN